MAHGSTQRTKYGKWLIIYYCILGKEERHIVIVQASRINWEHYSTKYYPQPSCRHLNKNWISNNRWRFYTMTWCMRRALHIILQGFWFFMLWCPPSAVIFLRCPSWFLLWSSTPSYPSLSLIPWTAANETIRRTNQLCDMNFEYLLQMYISNCQQSASDKLQNTNVQEEQLLTRSTAHSTLG